MNKRGQLTYKGEIYDWITPSEAAEFQAILEDRKRGYIDGSRVKEYIQKQISVGNLKKSGKSSNPFKSKGESYADHVKEWSVGVNPRKRGDEDIDILDALFG